MVSLTEEFEKELRAHIELIESNSSIEIVPAIVKEASDYGSQCITMGLLLAYPLARNLEQYIPVWSSYIELIDGLVWILLAFVIALFLRKSGLCPYLISKAYKQKKAIEKAESIFLNEGIFETKQRIGILIAVFLAEKTVVVLADKGFNSLVERDYWSRLGATLAKDFNRKKAGDEFFEALKEIEINVAPKFKIEGENPNELSDNLRKK